MLRVAANQRPCQSDHLVAARGQGAGGMALGRVRALLLMHLVQDQVPKEVPKMPFDEERGLVAPEFTVHLPQRRATTLHQPIAVLAFRVV